MSALNLFGIFLRLLSLKGKHLLKADLRKVVDRIFYAIRTGIPWNDMPQSYALSTCHRYFQEWEKLGIFQMAWAECLARYDEEFGIDWSKLNIDSSQAKAPLGGKKNRQKPCGQRKNRN